MTRLRSSIVALRAPANRSSFWGARQIERACLAVAAELRRRALITAAAVMLGGSSTLLACPMCFGAEETSMVDGAKVGVLVMLAITLVVQGGFAGFFLYLRRRAKRSAEMELEAEWSQLQAGSRTS